MKKKLQQLALCLTIGFFCLWSESSFANLGYTSSDTITLTGLKDACQDFNGTYVSITELNGKKHC
jgi:hypothetical protein